MEERGGNSQYYYDDGGGRQQRSTLQGRPAKETHLAAHRPDGVPSSVNSAADHTRGRCAHLFGSVSSSSSCQWWRRGNRVSPSPAPDLGVVSFKIPDKYTLTCRDSRGRQGFLAPRFGGLRGLRERESVCPQNRSRSESQKPNLAGDFSLDTQFFMIWIARWTCINVY